MVSFRLLNFKKMNNINIKSIHQDKVIFKDGSSIINDTKCLIINSQGEEAFEAIFRVSTLLNIGLEDSDQGLATLIDNGVYCFKFDLEFWILSNEPNEFVLNFVEGKYILNGIEVFLDENFKESFINFRKINSNTAFLKSFTVYLVEINVK